jgi:hypothetical protein
VLEFSAAEVAGILDTTPASVNSALPAWFDGREDVGRFFAERVFATPWRLVPLQVNGQLGFACYLREPGPEGFRLGAINVLSLRAGRIAEITGFLDPEVHRRSGLPTEWTDEFPGRRVSQRPCGN